MGTHDREDESDRQVGVTDCVHCEADKAGLLRPHATTRDALAEGKRSRKGFFNINLSSQISRNTLNNNLETTQHTTDLNC